MCNKVRKLVKILYEFDNNVKTIKHPPSISLISGSKIDHFEFGNKQYLQQNFIDFDEIRNEISNNSIDKYFNSHYKIEKEGVEKDLIDNLPMFEKMETELENIKILFYKDKKCYIDNFKCEEYLKFFNRIERKFRNHSHTISFLTGSFFTGIIIAFCKWILPLITQLF